MGIFQVKKSERNRMYIRVIYLHIFIQREHFFRTM